MNIHLIRRWLIGVGLGVAFLPVSWSAGYPERPITLVVPYGAGAAVDRAGRSLAQQLEKRLGQPVVVENVAGASGTLGARKVLRSAPDGYTIVLGTINDLIIAPSVVKAGYSIRDFTPVAKTALDMSVLVAHPSFPGNSADDLVKIARASAYALQVGVPGSATMLAFGASLLAEAGRFKMQPIAYKSGSPLITDLLGGQVQVGTIALSSVLPLVRQGKLKALGVLSSKRHPAAPEIPSVNEGQLIKGVQADLWMAVLAPAKLPADVHARLTAAVRDTMRDPAYKEAELSAGNIIPDFEESAAFERFVAKEQTRLKAMIENVKVE